MRRIRWFKAEWPVTLRTLAAKMHSDAFKEDKNEGFLIDRVRENSVEGRFVEKYSYEESVISPFGNESVFERVVYTQLEFGLSNTFPHIELWDPPRSTQSYISKLLEFNNFEVAIEPLSIDLIQWATAFELSINQKITIDFIQISGFEIERGVTAKIVVSGDKDVRDALQRIAKTKTYQLDKIHLKLFLDGALIPIQLANSGSVKLEAEHVDPFLSKLRSSLLQAQKNTKP
jgi:hypothetical protein